MKLRRLVDKIEDQIIESRNNVSTKSVYAQAYIFFQNGTLINGEKWKEEIVPSFYCGNPVRIKKIKQRRGKNGTKVYSAVLFFSPGRGGGAGVGIDPAASNTFFNMIGVDKGTIDEVEKAYSEFIKRNSRKINEEIRKWMMNPDNFLYNVVGWSNKDKYKIEDILFKNIKYEKPMVDPYRRKWPSGRTEIWAPVSASLEIIISEKRTQVR